MLPCQCHTAFSERLVFWQCHPSRVNYHLVSIRRRQNMQQSCKVYKSQTLHYTSQWVIFSTQTHHTGSFCKNKLGKMCWLKFTFSEKATKIDKIFTVNLTLTTQRQINGEDLVNLCGLLRKHEF